MNENAKKWVEALRSGKYKQGAGYLTRIIDDQEFDCCLGVACKLYQAEHGDLQIVKYHGMKSYDSKYAGVPEKVQKWLGMTSSAGKFGTPDKNFVYKSLAQENDNGKTFNEMATLIESEPEGLFSEV